MSKFSSRLAARKMREAARLRRGRTSCSCRKMSHRCRGMSRDVAGCRRMSRRCRGDVVGCHGDVAEMSRRCRQMSPNVTECHTISPLRHMGSTPTTCRHVPVTLGGGWSGGVGRAGDFGMSGRQLSGFALSVRLSSAFSLSSVSPILRVRPQVDFVAPRHG